MNALIAAVGPFSLLQIIIAYLVGAFICAVGILIECLWEKTQSNAESDAAAHDPLRHKRQQPGRRSENYTSECATPLYSTFHVYNPVLDTRTYDQPCLKQATVSHLDSRRPEV